jgi:hypothetical protein
MFGQVILVMPIKAYICDFSIAYGVTKIPIMHSLFTSKSPVHRKVVRQTFKDAAIIADLTNYPEYQTKP